MPLLLSSILTNPQRVHQPFLLLQSSTSQTCLPVLQEIVNQEHHKIPSKRAHTLLICFLHLPSSLTGETDSTSRDDKIKVLDYTNKVPGYDDSWADPREDIINTVKSGEHAWIYWYYETQQCNSCPWTIECDYRLGGYPRLRYRLYF